MKHDPLHEFGQLYIEQVRDDAIEHWQRVIQGPIKAPDLVRLSKQVNADFHGKIPELENLIAQVVDSCLTRFLRLFEENEALKLLQNGVDLNDASDGLVGELFSSEGWIAKFSRKPHEESD